MGDIRSVWLVSTFIQALLYGLYVMTLLHCLRWLMYRDEGWNLRHWTKINWAMLTITVIIFVCSTVNLGVTLLYLFLLINELPYNAASLYRICDVMSDLSGYAVVLIVDGVMIYRCWMVYGKSKLVIILPVIFWTGAFISSALSSYNTWIFINTKGSKQEQAEEMALWDGAASYFCNIATNVYATSAIIYRILSVTKANGQSPGRLRKTVRILGESGIIYTSMTAFALTTVMIDIKLPIDMVAGIANVMNFSLAGITFNLILIRVYSARVNEEDCFVDSKSAKGMSLSELQFNEPQASTFHSIPSHTNDGRADEIQDVSRSTGEVNSCRTDGNGN